MGDGGEFARNLDGADDVNWAIITAALPTGLDAQSKSERAKLWRQIDVNGNG